MIPTAISSSSTIRTRLHPARLLEMKRDHPKPRLAGKSDNGGGVTLQFREVLERLLTKYRDRSAK
jgi:hypothetical protein